MKAIILGASDRKSFGPVTIQSSTTVTANDQASALIRSIAWFNFESRRDLSSWGSARPTVGFIGKTNAPGIDQK
jgi:hypothetical protein